MRRFALLSVLAFAALSACTDRAPAAATPADSPPPALQQDRFLVKASTRDHDATLSALLQGLDRRDLTVFAVIDHAAGASAVGMTLEPTTLVIFGNPRGGTPLIAAQPLVGAELPLRALVYTRGGQTSLAYTGITYLGREYRLDAQAEVTERVRVLLDLLAAEATGN